MSQPLLPQSQSASPQKEKIPRAAFRNVALPQPYKPLLEPGEYGTELGLRPGTRMHRYLVNFALNEGGIGDYINYCVAFLWLARNAPWISGRIFVSSHIVPVVTEIMKGCPDWEVFPGEEAGNYIEPGTPVIGPELKMDGRNVSPQLLNPVGAHLIDLGFAYYANQCPAPAGEMLPRLTFEREKLPHKVRHLRGKYIVFPTGAMTPSRYVSGEHLNPLIQHVKQAGFTPVFLGKRVVVKGLEATFPEDIDYEAGLDLRDQTNLLGAAAIMHHAAGTAGIDSGLLHLAACTDSPVLFGYSIAGPDQRAPRRDWSRTWNLTATREELPCANCQSHLKLLIGHTFHKCFYNDNACIDLLFDKHRPEWFSALDECFRAHEGRQNAEVQEPSSEAEIPGASEVRADVPGDLQAV